MIPSSNGNDGSFPTETLDLNSAEGRWVALRPVLRSDYMTLYSWATDLRTLYLWSSDRRIPPFEEFVLRMDRVLHETQMLLMLERQHRAPIGFCQAYDINLSEGWASLLVFADDAHRSHPHPAEGGLIFVDFLFKHFALRKLYADVFEYNEESLKILLKGGFREEARLPNHIWYEGKYWSQLKLALYREEYMSVVRRRWDMILQIQHDFNSLLTTSKERV